MSTAQEVAELDPLALSTLVRLVAAPLQARAATSALTNALHEARPEVTLDDFVGSTLISVWADGETIRDLLQHPERRYNIKLWRDPIITTPWHRDRLLHSIGTIGHARKAGNWRQDWNHKVNLIMPFGVALVEGGNHSIAAGIANGEGTVLTTDVTDVSRLYPHIKYDGISFACTESGRLYHSPRDEEAGMLFEIGRIMLEKNVIYDCEQAPTTEPLGASPEREILACYNVILDGIDTGESISESGATRALIKSGLAPKSDQAQSAIINGAPFTYRDNKDRSFIVSLNYFVRQHVKNDLDDVTDRFIRKHCS